MATILFVVGILNNKQFNMGAKFFFGGVWICIGPLINVQKGGHIMYGGYGKNKIRILEIASKVDDFILFLVQSRKGGVLTHSQLLKGPKCGPK